MLRELSYSFIVNKWSIPAKYVQKSTHHLVIMQQFCAIPKPGYTRWFISLIGGSHVIIEEKIIWLKFKVYVFRTNVRENSLKITHSHTSGKQGCYCTCWAPCCAAKNSWHHGLGCNMRCFKDYFEMITCRMRENSAGICYHVNGNQSDFSRWMWHKVMTSR